MTAGTIVSNACKQAGLVEDGTTTSIVSTLGIGTLSIGGGLTAAAGTVPTTAAEIGLGLGLVLALYRQANSSEVTSLTKLEG